MWAARVLLTFLAIASPSQARDYLPDTREALAIRPEMPVQRVKPSVPCLTPPEKAKLVTWVIRDKHGNVLVVGSQMVRQRC